MTKNSRPFAVTSTTCSTLLLAVCFFHPSISSTPSVRADSSSIFKSSVVTSFETDIYKRRKKIQDTSYIHGILMHVAPGLFSWSMAAGLLAFSSRHFAPAINHGLLFASHYISISPSSASVAGGECRPRSEASCNTTYVWERDAQYPKGMITFFDENINASNLSPRATSRHPEDVSTSYLGGRHLYSLALPDTKWIVRGLITYM